ncbi:hypothetical protein ACFU5O_27905 [Streptomyces sp. NPDC057445]|uniref:hypothetical protein n=1 Tax=Streptomyces sp. NPDC057445 TaxID=3346136 RepID=UPI0036C5BE53
MAEDLYDRYMKASAALRRHENECGECSPAERCLDGQRLFESFARLQDAYNNGLRQPRPPHR